MAGWDWFNPSGRRNAGGSAPNGWDDPHGGAFANMVRQQMGTGPAVGNDGYATGQSPADKLRQAQIGLIGSQAGENQAQARLINDAVDTRIPDENIPEFVRTRGQGSWGMTGQPSAPIVSTENVLSGELPPAQTFTQASSRRPTPGAIQFPGTRIGTPYKLPEFDLGGRPAILGGLSIKDKWGAR